jgi:hypothetical protein
MKRALTLAIALAALAALGFAVPARAGEKSALGTWDVVASTPDGPLPSVMTVTKGESKGKIKAEVDLGGMKRTVSEEALEGDVLRLKVQYEGVIYAIQGKIAGDAMEGTWEGGGNSGTLTAKRRP